MTKKNRHKKQIYTKAFHSDRQKRINERNTSHKGSSSVLYASAFLTIAIVSAVWQLWTINAQATVGEQIKEYEEYKNELIEERDKLQQIALSASSLSVIEDKALDELHMRRAGDRFISVSSHRLASLGFVQNDER